MIAVSRKDLLLSAKEDRQAARVSGPSANISDFLTSNNAHTKWDKNLFIETVTMVHQFMQCHHQTLSTEQIIAFTEEIYNYSIKSGKLDPQFANWVLSQALQA